MKQKVVIVGAGFGGFFAAKTLGSSSFEVTLLDRNNYHLFVPLLYQVATAGLSPADIASPIRFLLRKHSNISIAMEEVVGVDCVEKKVLARCGNHFPYDQLILAPGSSYHYFKHPEWKTWAPAPRTLTEALNIREKVLLAFERAEMEVDPDLRRQHLVFCVVGGGATGVEMAGAIAELAKKVFPKESRRFSSEEAKIYLFEAANHILPGFSLSLALKAEKSLRKLGVEVFTQSSVEDIREDRIVVQGKPIFTRNVVWAAGIQAAPVGKWLNLPTDRLGRLEVLEDLSLPNHPNIFVIGDAAAVKDSQGQYLSALAPVAKQEGIYVAKKLLQRKEKGKKLPPFRYRDKGKLATIGRSSAVGQVGPLKFSGFLAWLVWAFVHILYLLGPRNRLMVFFQWVWAYVTFERGARLIVGTKPCQKDL